MNQIRVVIDTNVFVSSFFGGNPRRVIEHWRNGSLILCLSESIITEYTLVLNRMGLENEQELEEILALFARGYNSLYTARTPHLTVISDDPDDNKFLECAVALGATHIISGDKHLTDLKSYMTILCITAKQFLEMLPHSE